MEEKNCCAEKQNMFFLLKTFKHNQSVRRKKVCKKSVGLLQQKKNAHLKAKLGLSQGMES